MKALDLATETQENWIYIQGNYLHKEGDGRVTVTDVTDTLIKSYKNITCQQVNTLARELFVTNQRRVNLKLCSQNHNDKPEKQRPADASDQIVEQPANPTEDDAEEYLASPEITEENKKARAANTEYYTKTMSLKQQKIEDVAEFRQGQAERYEIRGGEE